MKGWRPNAIAPDQFSRWCLNNGCYGTAEFAESLSVIRSVVTERFGVVLGCISRIRIPTAFEPSASLPCIYNHGMRARVQRLLDIFLNLTSLSDFGSSKDCKDGFSELYALSLPVLNMFHHGTPYSSHTWPSKRRGV